MPKAISTDTTTAPPIISAAVAVTRRRALFTSAAVGGALALPVTALTGLHPDAELLLACQQHSGNADAFNADDADGDDDNPLWVEYERTRDIIWDAKPVTLAGLAAKAKAAKKEAERPDGEESPREGPKIS
jgi:hypothetical protein